MASQAPHTTPHKPNAQDTDNGEPQDFPLPGRSPQSRPPPADEDLLSAFKLDGDEDLPRPAPIRTSSSRNLRKKAQSASPAACEIEEAPPETSPELPQGGESSSGWGWGLGTMGGMLSSLAGDVQGLTTSLQKAFQEDALRDDEREDDRDGSRGDVSDEQENPMRRAVLERLQGDDTSLEMGLKAIDDQVGHLSAGVGKAFGSFLGGLGGAVKNAQALASKVESAAITTTKDIVGTVEGGVREVQQLEAVKVAQSGLQAAAGLGGKIAQQAEERLETLGRRAISLLENRTPDEQPRGGEDEPEEPMTFDNSFYIYGGQQHYEDLEVLSNDCAKLCNKARAHLDGTSQKNLDDLLKSLHPIFEVDGSPSESEDEDGDAKNIDVRLTPLYDLVAALTEGSKEHASEMTARAEARIQEWIDETAEPPSAPSSPGSLDSPGSVHPALKVDLREASREGRRILHSIHEEGVKRLSESCSCCIKGLLNVGKSISGRTQILENTSWPVECEETAFLLRSYTVRLVIDLEAVAGAYVEALLGVGTSCQETLGDSSLHQKSSWMASDLEVDAGTAVSRIKDGFKNLMYIILYTSLTPMAEASS